MNMMSTALNKTATKRWDPANIRPPPPQSEPLLVDFSEELDAQSGEIVSACQDAKDAEASVEAKCAAVNESAYFNKPETIGTRPRTPTIPPSALPGGTFAKASSLGERYRIPEPDWHPDTFFFVFAYLQAHAADPDELNEILRQNEEIKKMIFASKHRAKVEIRSMKLFEYKTKMEDRCPVIEDAEGILCCFISVASIILLVRLFFHVYYNCSS